MSLLLLLSVFGVHLDSRSVLSGFSSTLTRVRDNWKFPRYNHLSILVYTTKQTLVASKRVGWPLQSVSSQISACIEVSRNDIITSGWSPVTLHFAYYAILFILFYLLQRFSVIVSNTTNSFQIKDNYAISVRLYHDTV